MTLLFDFGFFGPCKTLVVFTAAICYDPCESSCGITPPPASQGKHAQLSSRQHSACAARGFAGTYGWVRQSFEY
jgi:hypothetical protein